MRRRVIHQGENPFGYHFHFQQPLIDINEHLKGTGAQKSISLDRNMTMVNIAILKEMPPMALMKCNLNVKWMELVWKWVENGFSLISANIFIPVPKTRLNRNRAEVKSCRSFFIISSRSKNTSAIRTLVLNRVPLVVISKSGNDLPHALQLFSQIVAFSWANEYISLNRKNVVELMRFLLLMKWWRCYFNGTKFHVVRSKSEMLGHKCARENCEWKVSKYFLVLSRFFFVICLLLLNLRHC